MVSGIRNSSTDAMTLMLGSSVCLDPGGDGQDGISLKRFKGCFVISHFIDVFVKVNQGLGGFQDHLLLKPLKNH